MKIVITLIFTLTVVACSGTNEPIPPLVDGTNPVLENCPKNTTYNTTIQPNSIQLTLVNNNKPNHTAKEGVVVQLNQQGNCIQSDVNGHVSFTNLATGTYDVHVFDPSEKNWFSYYHIPVTDTAGFQIPELNVARYVIYPYTRNSFIKYKGSLTTTPLNGVSLLYFSDQEDGNCNSNAAGSNPMGNFGRYSMICYFSIGNNNTVMNELWFFEIEYDTAEVNSDSRIVNEHHLQKFSTQTTTDSNIANVKDIIFDTTLSKPKTTLMQFDSITLPTDLNLRGLYINGDITHYLKSTGLYSTRNYITLYHKVLDNLIPNPSFNAYVPDALNITQTTIKLDTTGGLNSGLSWKYTDHYPISSTGLMITPKLSSLPTLIPNQQGNVIQWNSNSALTKQEISISNKVSDTTEVYWNITIYDNSNSITLPTIPTDITPLFIEGKQYQIAIGGIAEYPNAKGITVKEEYSNSNSDNIWTR